MDTSPDMLDLLREELIHHLHELESSPRNTVAIASCLQRHACALKSIGTVPASRMLAMAKRAGNPDIMLAFLDAGAQPERHSDLFLDILMPDVLYDMNGHVLSDADIAPRLCTMHDAHGVCLSLPAIHLGAVSTAAHMCVLRDRLECLRVIIEIDPHARGYTLEDHNSLLHIAAAYCRPRIVRLLLESGWTLQPFDVNFSGLSPLGTCMIMTGISSQRASRECCATLEALLKHVHDASTVMRNSGLCDVSEDAIGKVRVEEHEWEFAPVVAPTRMHVYMCAAVRARSILPRRVLQSPSGGHGIFEVFERGPAAFRTLPLDEHVYTGIGDPIYLRDSLRIECKIVLRFAVALDAICLVEAIAKHRHTRAGWHPSSNELPYDGMLTTGLTGVSPTLRCWAWMRRLHAVRARNQVLRREHEAVRRLDSV